jgi:hypothetical protein
VFISYFSEAIEYMLEAIKHDKTECLLWWRLGTRATRVGNLILARNALSEALNINHLHWPSIDAIIHINYVLVI